MIGILSNRLRTQQSCHIDSRLNTYRPRISQRDHSDGWILDLIEDTWECSLTIFNDSRAVLMVRVNGDDPKHVLLTQVRSFGAKHGIPLETAVTSLIERWRFLKLIVEL